jgi:ribosomal-protein-alanine N-acetyltransferase
MDVTLELAPLDSTDVGLIRSWRNDYRIWRWCRQSDLISDAEQARWFNRQAEDPAIKMYKLVVKTDGKALPVGVAGFTSIDFQHSRAEFSLYVAPEAQGQGLGRRFLEILFTHGFQNLGLSLIWGETFDGNPAAKTFEALGMVKEGTRRQFYWKDGRRIDAHLYSITREEWHGRDALGALRSPGSGLPSGGLSETGEALYAAAGASKEGKKAGAASEPPDDGKAQASRHD